MVPTHTRREKKSMDRCLFMHLLTSGCSLKGHSAQFIHQNGCTPRVVSDNFEIYSVAEYKWHASVGHWEPNALKEN